MPDKWAQYAAPAQPATGDKWAQYAAPADTPPPADDRNGLQRAFDDAVSTPSAYGPRWLDKFGRSGLAQLTPFVHPIQTGQAMLNNAFGGPIDTKADMQKSIAGNIANDLGDEYKQNGAAGVAGNLAGQLIGGEVAGLPLKGVSKLAGTAIKGTGMAARAASATPESMKLAGTRFLTKGTPGELLQSALKPGVKYGANASQMLEQALPDVIAADPKLQGVSGFAKASDAAKDAQFGKYNDLIAPYRKVPEGAAGPVRPGTISGEPIARAQMESIPTMDLLEDSPKPGQMRRFDVPAGDGGTIRMGATTEPSGGIVRRTQQKAAAYNQDLQIPFADALREDANAKLNSFYNKAGGDRAAALSDPETARVKAAGDALRGTLYPKLEEDAGLAPGTVNEMQERYGRLADTADIANKREPVFARHDPVTLSQKIAVGHGGPVATAFNWAKEKALNSLTNSDALVNSAVDRYKNPDATPLAPRKGMLPRVTFGAGDLAKKLGGDIANVPVQQHAIPYALATKKDQR